MMSFPIASLFAWETHIFKQLGKNQYSIPSDISKLLDYFLISSTWLAQTFYGPKFEHI